MPDNKARAQEMTQCQGRTACENAVIDKYKKINAEHHESVVGCKGAQECVNKANEVGELQADYEGDAEGTTKAAISAGTITIRDQENQQQDVADLSRDVENANGSISPIFDKEKEQKRLEMAQTLGDIGSQAGDIARTAGEINAINAGKAELAEKGVTAPCSFYQLAHNESDNGLAEYTGMRQGGKTSRTHH